MLLSTCYAIFWQWPCWTETCRRCIKYDWSTSQQQVISFVFCFINNLMSFSFSQCAWNKRIFVSLNLLEYGVRKDNQRGFRWFYFQACIYHTLHETQTEMYQVSVNNSPCETLVRHLKPTMENGPWHLFRTYFDTLGEYLSNAKLKKWKRVGI